MKRKVRIEYFIHALTPLSLDLTTVAVFERTESIFPMTFTAMDVSYRDRSVILIDGLRTLENA
jgi:hypothetical protein